MPLKKLFVVFFLACLAAAPGPGTCLASEQTPVFPSLAESIRFETAPVFCGEPVPLENREVLERLEKEMLLILWDRPQVILWLKRAGRYFPVIDRLLKENGAPADLKYTAVIESALRPDALSSKNAAGFWQFRKSTGVKYGLAIDEGIDQRRDIFASTSAAIQYLKELHDLFGSWTLAVAAYNMGEQGMQAEIDLQKTSDFYRLELPDETERFIMKIVAAKTIISQPEKYGFILSPEDIYPPMEFEHVRVDIRGRTPIRLLAEACGVFYKDLKRLNPQLRGHYIAEGNHEIFVPPGTSNVFSRAFEKLYNQWVKETDKSYYTVQKGDSLYTIAQRHDVPLLALLIWNNLNFRDVIHPGDKIVVYSSGRKTP